MAKTTTYQSFDLPTQQILLHAEPDLDGHADAFEACWPNMFLHCPAFGWLFWNKTHWNQNGAKGALRGGIKQVLYMRRHIAVDNDKEQLIKAAKVNRSNILAVEEDLMHRLYIGPEEFDNKPFMLNCKNGAVNLVDGVIYKHSPKAHKFTYCLPIEYDPKADTSIIEKHFRDDLANPGEMVPFLKRAFGYSLTGNTRDEKLFYVYGPPRSGKDTGIGAFLSLLGSPLAQEVTFETLTERRYGDTNRADVAALRSSRFVMASESERFRQMSAPTIKNLTGGNQQFVAYKYRDHFSYTPQFKMWLISNWPVNVDIEDDAAWGRVVLIEFPNGRLGKEKPERKEFTRSKEFKTALLAWAIEGAQDWLENGLQVPQCAEAGKQKQRDSKDSVKEFLADCVQDNPFDHVLVSELRMDYENWCIDNGYEAKSPRAFSMAMKRLGHVGKPKRISGKKPMRVYEGLSMV